MFNIVPRPPRRYGPEDPPKSQVERIFAKFGGASKLRKALADVGATRCISALYRWNMERPAGTGGLVPSSAWPHVLKAARYHGIVITPEDLMPTEG